MKSDGYTDFAGARRVTPCVGVWIEIRDINTHKGWILVTPCVGVWIEIILKRTGKERLIVTPCVGVWIEIIIDELIPSYNKSHSLRGSVD